MRSTFRESQEARAAHVSFKINTPEGIQELLRFAAKDIIAPGLMCVAAEEFRQPHACGVFLLENPLLAPQYLPREGLNSSNAWGETVR